MTLDAVVIIFLKEGGVPQLGLIISVNRQPAQMLTGVQSWTGL